MKRKKILTAAVLSASIGLGTNSLLAQTTPGGSMGPTNPSGPIAPMPRETQPTIPGQAAPGMPQTSPMPGQPAPGMPQTSPMPGQPGTIPERVQRPNLSDEKMAVTSDDIRKAQNALKAKGLNPGDDGRMDAKTQQALRDFQKSNNLPVTGVLDDKTAEKLGISKNSDMKSMPERAGSSSMPNSSLPNSDSKLPKSGSSLPK
ncbi:MAG TPA: peptidoglycan-binding protein [Candidatus Binatia bacterium]|nr:peptidoglycan-binding protein [Candidatus Binatia bacterium]